MATRKIDTEISLAGEKEFNDQMKAVNSNLKGLSAEMSLTTAEFAENANSTEALKSKQKILTDQIDQQREKVRALNEMYKRAAEAKGEDSASADAYRAELNKAQAALLKMEQRLDDNEKALKKARQPLEQLSDVYKKVSKAVGEFKDKHETAFKVLSKAGDATKGAIKALGALSAAGTAATGAVAALAIEGIGTLTEYAKEAAENGDPAFAGLAKNLTALDGASKSAKAALGAVLMPALESLSGEGAMLLNDFSEAMAATNGDTEKMGEVISEYLGKAIELIKANLPKIMKLGGDLIEGLGDGLIENAPEMLDDAQIIITKLLDGIAEHAPEVGTGAVQLIKMISDTLIKSTPDLIKAGGEIVISLLQALPELITTLVEGFFSPENLTAIKDIGVGIVTAIWDGISGMLGWLWDKVKGIFKNKKIDAPEIDADNVGGYAGGLDYVPYDNFPALLHKGERVLTAQESKDYRNGGSGGGNTVNVTFYAQQVTDADVDMIVDTVNRRLGGE